MYRLFSLSALFLFIRADPRTPKIYNVLISTKKNLSPSHALPVYEPVLRTTSLGIALPPFFYQSPISSYQPNFITKTSTIVGKNERSEDNEELQKSLQPFPVEQYIPYYTSQVLNNRYFTPLNQPEQPQEQSKLLPNQELYQKSEDSKNVIANLKRNPNIPDVPPPALPTRNNM